MTEVVRNTVPQWADKYPDRAVDLSHLSLPWYCINCQRKTDTTYLTPNCGPFCDECMDDIRTYVNQRLQDEYKELLLRATNAELKIEHTDLQLATARHSATDYLKALESARTEMAALRAEHRRISRQMREIAAATDDGLVKVFGFNLREWADAIEAGDQP